MKALVAILVSLILISSGAMVISPAIAIPDNASDKAKVKVPENAVEIAPGIFYLGSVIHHGEVVEGLMIFHHRSGHSGGPGGGGGDDTTGDDSKCFTFLAKGAKWKGEAEPWLVNPSNIRGLTESEILTRLSSDINQWEVAAGTNILGDGTSSTTDILVADTISPDDKNEVYFADVDSPGAIAVTIVWGHFFGPPFARDLIEWDMVFDDVSYDWSLNAPEDAVLQMDFDNIAAHELGHSVGMGHSTTDDTCLEQTMYPTAAFEEIKKRTLELGDKTGVAKLYS